MKIEFDRQDYLALEEIFEVGQLDDVTLELSEFSDDIEDMAYELAYTRYELAKAEARHTALVEAVRGLLGSLDNGEFKTTITHSVAAEMAEKVYRINRAEVDRLLMEEK